MNLKEQLAEKKAALQALEENIKSGDENAIAQGEKLVEEIKGLEKSIEAAEKANALLSQIGKKENNEEENKMSEKTGIQALDLMSLKANRGSVATFIKAAGTVTGTTIGEYDRSVVAPVPALNVRDLFGSESISGNALTYFVMGATEGAPAATNEGTAKPQIQPTYSPVTKALAKIASYIKETDEILSDAPFLESAIRNRGMYEHRLAVEGYLLTQLQAVSGIGAVTGGISFDNILKAKLNIMTATGFEADAVILNPADMLTLLQTKVQSGSAQYVLGGPMYGPYGNGAYNSNPTVWGMPIILSSKATSGTAIVGAFRQGASVVGKSNEGLRVEVSNSDQDDFIKNLVTVRIEERLLLATRVPAAFSTIST